MGNKRKILDTARHLFNEQGLKQVTARAICKEIGISPGSFSYHFPDKSRIIATLYTEMREEMAAAVGDLATAEVSVLTYLETHRRHFKIQIAYRFFYLNLFEIMTQYPEIGDQYRQSTQQERVMARQMILYYIQSGIIKPDLSPTEIDRIINVGQILNNFWALDAELMQNLTGNGQQAYYMQICCGLLEPYLMPDSLQIYRDYFVELEKQEN